VSHEADRSTAGWPGSRPPVSVGRVSLHRPEGAFGTHGGTAYPPPVYDGDGDASARYRPAGTPAELVRPGGTQVEYLATGASTEGLFGLYRYSMSPQPSGPGPHFHRSLTESFFVLSGRLAIFDGHTWLDTGPGDWVHVPIGGVHGFRNESGEPVTMLLHFSPGAPREEYFEQVASAQGMSPEERMEFYLRHDNHWV
jgi:mannose-6-phosphate isomerase-like protein (cupin superfamily)